MPPSIISTIFSYWCPKYEFFRLHESFTNIRFIFLYPRTTSFVLHYSHDFIYDYYKVYVFYYHGTKRVCWPVWSHFQSFQVRFCIRMTFLLVLKIFFINSSSSYRISLHPSSPVISIFPLGLREPSHFSFQYLCTYLS